MQSAELKECVKRVCTVMEGGSLVLKVSGGDAVMAGACFQSK